MATLEQMNIVAPSNGARKAWSVWGVRSLLVLALVACLPLMARGASRSRGVSVRSTGACGGGFWAGVAFSLAEKETRRRRRRSDTFAIALRSSTDAGAISQLGR